MTVLWHTLDQDTKWNVEAKPEDEIKWSAAEAKVLRTVRVRGLRPHRVYEAELKNLKPGKKFDYRVLLEGKSVFEASGRARRPAGEPHRFAVYGDMSQDSRGQRALANQIYKDQPEYLVSVGDVVYSRGLASEYYRKYFPIYNCDSVSPGKCVPLLRSVNTVAILGNHDAPSRVNLGGLPDALAFFYYWSLPSNGPVENAEAGHCPELSGSSEVIRQFFQTAPNFPRMAMYSFDYGDAHWTMLDTDSYVDWTDPKLRDWLRKDIRSARKAAWRFVAMHHPAFQSSKHHFSQQWARLLVDIFEEEKVDVVFAGHVHNYQRSAPIRFKINPAEAAIRPMPKGKIDGEITIDKTFDGKTKTKPDGIIHLVTGAGGAGLVDSSQERKPSTWQKYTVRFVSTIHSFTSVDISPSRLEFRQISSDGRELDRFTVSR